MRTLHLRGTTEQLNRLNLPAGRIAINLDNNNIRIYDGEIQGGYEVETQQAYDPPLPGPKELIAGDLETGFYGETTPEDFISYGDLSALVGLSAGTLHNQDQPWLKFSMDQRPVYVSKRSIRSHISWDQLNAVDLVFGRVVQIGEYQYTVRLMSGLDDSGTYTAGGEWNRLLYPIHVDDPNQEGWGIGYSNADLGFNYSAGSRSWCQETHPTAPGSRVLRGYNSVSNLTSDAAYSSVTNSGWSPILIPLV